MIYIVSDFRGTYHRVVDRLENEARAELIELDPDRALDRTISKRGILRQMLASRPLRLRNRWTSDDAVLVMSWYLLPLLLFMRVRLLARPRRLVSMGAFVHDDRLRKVVNLLLRGLNSDELEFIVFSEAERRNLVDVLGLSAARVHRVLYRGKIPEIAPTTESSDGGYVFTGGYSNRDYETFFAAVRTLRADVVAVASALNELREAPANVDLRLDVPWDEFGQLIAHCALLVVPLRAGGEASGQNVLFRGIQQGRPVVATRHDSLIDYLGEDYPGFVPPHDADALRAAIERGLFDEAFRRSLLDGVKAASTSFREHEAVEVEIVKILSH